METKKQGFTQVNYCNKMTSGFATRIMTDRGLELLIPHIPTDVRKKMKAHHWHLMDEEYYNCDLVDVIVKTMFGMKIYRSMIVIDVNEDWWCWNCGSMVTPYRWDGQMAVIAWKPHKS